MNGQKIRSVDVVVVGAGLAGLSTAYHLAKNSKLKILVLEQEKFLGGHASGRNAGMIRQTVGDAAIAQMAFLGRKMLPRYRTNGSILLADAKKIKEIQAIQKTARTAGIKTVWLSSSQAEARVPLLCGRNFKAALYCPSDGLLHTQDLLDDFSRELRSLGVPIIFNQRPQAMEFAGGQFHIQISSGTISAKKVVNAAGAWCAQLASEIGAQKIPLKAYRRHLYFSQPVRLKQADWPFVWDLSQDFYFRPEGKGFILSPCDKVAMSQAVLGERKELVDRRVQVLLKRKMQKYPRLAKTVQIQSAVSGLRTMTPDGRFILGEDRRLKGFYWAAGLGGHGVTTCFSVGKLLSDIILGKKADPGLVRAFNPGRFQ